MTSELALSEHTKHVISVPLVGHDQPVLISPGFTFKLFFLWKTLIWVGASRMVVACVREFPGCRTIWNRNMQIGTGLMMVTCCSGMRDGSDKAYSTMVENCKEGLYFAGQNDESGWIWLAATQTPLGLRMYFTQVGDCSLFCPKAQCFEMSRPRTPRAINTSHKIGLTWLLRIFR
eukprot:2568481-Amphidinium_carterae.1